MAGARSLFEETIKKLQEGDERAVLQILEWEAPHVADDGEFSFVRRQNEKDNDKSLLHYAAGFDRIQIVRKLIELGANPEALTRLDETPLMCAARYDRVQAIQTLLDVAGDKNIDAQDKNGDTALHISASTNKLSAAKELLSRGARILRNKAGKMPQEMAVCSRFAHKNTELIRLLREASKKQEADGLAPRKRLRTEETLSTQSPRESKAAIIGGLTSAKDDGNFDAEPDTQAEIQTQLPQHVGQPESQPVVAVTSSKAPEQNHPCANKRCGRPHCCHIKTFRTRDGRYVRSKMEKIIADHLDALKLRYYYEPPIALINPKNLGSMDIKPDFYLPDEDIYIEYFGRMDDKRYRDNAKWKQAAYLANQLKLVSLDSRDESNIEEILTQKLQWARVESMMVHGEKTK